MVLYHKMMFTRAHFFPFIWVIPVLFFLFKNGFCQGLEANIKSARFILSEHILESWNPVNSTTWLLTIKEVWQQRKDSVTCMHFLQSSLQPSASWSGHPVMWLRCYQYSDFKVRSMWHEYFNCVSICNSSFLWLFTRTPVLRWNPYFKYIIPAINPKPNPNKSKIILYIKNGKISSECEWMAIVNYYF